MALPDFAQFIQMETKRIKHFFGCLVHQWIDLTQNNKATKSLCKKCVKSIHESIKLSKGLTAVHFQHNKTFSFVVLCKIYSLVNQTAKNVLFFLFPFQWIEQNQACHIYLRVYELYRIALSLAQSLSTRSFWGDYWRLQRKYGTRQICKKLLKTASFKRNLETSKWKMKPNRSLSRS